MLFKGYLGFNTQHKFRFYVKPFLEKQSFNCLFPSYIVIECISWCCSATKSCLMLCDPMNYSMPVSLSFTISQSLLKLNVHWVGDAIHPSHSLSPPSPPAFNLSQDQSLFQRVGSSHQLAKVLELQHPSFQWIQSCFPLGLTGLISLQSKGLWRVYSSTKVQKHQSLGAEPS